LIGRPSEAPQGLAGRLVVAYLAVNRHRLVARDELATRCGASACPTGPIPR